MGFCKPENNPIKLAPVSVKLSKVFAENTGENLRKMRSPIWISLRINDHHLVDTWISQGRIDAEVFKRNTAHTVRGDHTLGHGNNKSRLDKCNRFQRQLCNICYRRFK